MTTTDDRAWSWGEENGLRDAAEALSRPLGGGFSSTRFLELHKTTAPKERGRLLVQLIRAYLVALEAQGVLREADPGRGQGGCA